MNTAAYELLEEIGAGPNSRVILAWDRELKRRVAIKQIADNLRQDPRRMEQFWENTQFLANLEHDNILKVYGADQQQGWVVMELMQTSVAARCAQGPLKPDLVRSVLRQTLDALDFLHGRNRVHGQVHPSNILINDQGRVKLSDFAGNSSGGEFRRPTASKYVAPELLQPQFGPTGPTVDLYCLGFTALELLIGPGFDALFKGVTADKQEAGLTWMRWHGSASEHLEPAAKLVPGVPPDLAAVIDRLLKKNVSERFQSAEEVRRALADRPLEYFDVAEAKTEPQPAEPAKPKPAPIKLPKFDTEKLKRQLAKLPKIDRQWLNVQLKKPPVLYSVCGVIVLLTLAVLFWPQHRDEVTLQFEPADSQVTIDGQPATLAEGKAIVNLVASSLAVRAQRPGYATLDRVFTSEELHSPGFRIRLQPEFVLPSQLAAAADATPGWGGLPQRITASPLVSAGAPLELVLIAPGEAAYGTDAVPLDSGELPRQVVRLDEPIYISVTEISNRQFATFLQKTGAASSATPSPAGDSLPAAGVTFEQAQQMCHWLGGRLPTEVEWEHAARGSEGRDFPWGAGPPTPERCNLAFASGGSARAVDSLPDGATPQGLMNMLGNVAEWCEGVYAAGATEDAQTPGVGRWPAIRGGSFLEVPRALTRLTMRANHSPEGAADIGFRVVIPAQRKKIETAAGPTPAGATQKDG